MENILKNNKSKLLLIGQINGLTEISKQTKKRLLKSKTPESMSYLAIKKSFIKGSLRHRLLAYAFLSGKLYSQIEKSCSEKPHAHLIFKIIESLDPIWHPVTRWRYNSSELDIKNWLENKMS